MHKPDAGAAIPSGDDRQIEAHWEMFAEAMDLTIEGHRLIAHELGYETKLLWRGGVSWFRDLIAGAPRRRSTPST